ncbi:MAG: phenylacetate--CoA ligase family protein [Theionarchaea archaeon]|nr:phenylacetate--CoA ligase family protein [Theionarchaea archaeon]
MIPRILFYIWQIHREQYFSPQKLQQIQNDRLHSMIVHVYGHCQFYRRRFEEQGITPSDILTSHDLSLLEPTTKEDLQEHSADMIAEGYSPETCYVFHTSGSTGTPALMVLDADTMAYQRAESIIEFMEAGYRPWEKLAYTKRTPWKSHLLQKIGVLRSYHIESTLPDLQQIQLLRTLNPSLIVSYPTLLYSIARTAHHHGLSGITPRSVLIGGEILTPHVRQFIEAVFHTHVFETYATVEFGTVARECSQGNWHINSTQNIVEFENGKIFITGLINKALPLLRYDIGDVGYPKEGACSCGNTHPLMKILEGRSGDFMILPDGREISPLKIGRTKMILDRTLAARRYQIIQEDLDHFTIRIIPTSRFTPTIADTLKEQLREDLQYRVTVDIELVDHIPLIDDRKQRIIISRIKKKNPSG